MYESAYEDLELQLNEDRSEREVDEHYEKIEQGKDE